MDAARDQTSGQRPPKPRTYNGDLRRLPRSLAHLGTERVWVVWRWSWDGTKWTKPPYRADSPDRFASTSDPTTWGDYQTALRQVLAGKADGLGFAVKGRNIGGNDLDHCRDPETGMIAPWAREYCEQFPGAYTEVTVSGTGLRILGTSKIHLASKFPLPEKGNGARIELFSDSNHYLTLSCNELGSCRTRAEHKTTTRRRRSSNSSNNKNRQ
jgi:primase-polymerase (primpol)-like protein